MSSVNELASGPVSGPISGPFYHGTKADLKAGDLITPGHRSNYAHGERTISWVYMSAILSGWAAELAQGDGPGRVYIVEPTGPFEDDPDLTDKRFPGNPTKSYRSREPLRVVGEVTDWPRHTPDEIQAMKDGLARMRAVQQARIGHIPTVEMMNQTHARADAVAHEWAPDAKYVSCALLMVIQGQDVALSSTSTYHSTTRNATHTIDLPHRIETPLVWKEGEISSSGRITDVTSWFDAWVAVMESCITEIGLSRETRIWISVDADNDTLRFRVDADGTDRSWQRHLTLARGVLTDAEQGNIWDARQSPPRPNAGQ